jgi:alcohol dehydrogenase (cytochrome c)
VTARLVLVVLVGCAAALHAQVPFDRILQSGAEPHHWLTYSGNVQGHRHSPLTQITPANVRGLELQWVFQAESLEKFEATPLVVDGVLYTVQPPNDVVAIDAATGRIFWTYSHTERRRQPQRRAAIAAAIHQGLPNPAIQPA